MNRHIIPGLFLLILLSSILIKHHMDEVIGFYYYAKDRISNGSKIEDACMTVSLPDNWWVGNVTDFSGSSTTRYRLLKNLYNGDGFLVVDLIRMPDPLGGDDPAKDTDGINVTERLGYFFNGRKYFYSHLDSLSGSPVDLDVLGFPGRRIMLISNTMKENINDVEELIYHIDVSPACDSIEEI